MRPPNAPRRGVPAEDNMADALDDNVISNSDDDLEAGDDPDEDDSHTYFPMQACRALWESMNQLASYPAFRLEHLADCARAVAWQYKRPNRLPISKEARTFVQELMLPCYEKLLLNDTYLRLSQCTADAVFEALLWAVSAAAAGLHALYELDSEGEPVLVDSDDTLADVAIFNSVLHLCLDQLSCIYKYDFVKQPPLNLALENARRFCAAMGSQVGPLLPVEKGLNLYCDAPNEWTAHLIRHFEAAGGFHAISKVLDCPEPTLETVDRLLFTLRVVTLVTRRELMAEFDEATTRHLETDDVRPALDSTHSAVLSSILENAGALFQSTHDPEFSDDKLYKLHRALVKDLLKSSNFNKLLFAVRECLKLLQRSVALDDPEYPSLQSNVDWMEQEKIIRQMLRANLHQRQYANLVMDILVILTEYSLITEEHLEMLWSVTEQEGTFDVVKTNVYCILAELAKRLSPELLEVLFHKFDTSRQGRSLADSLNLLDLLRRLAASDTGRKLSCVSDHPMATRLLEMIWQLTMPSDAPPELLQSDVMPDVLRDYGQHEYLTHYMQRCVEALTSRTNVYSALHVLHKLLCVYPCGDSFSPLLASTRKEAIEYRPDAVAWLSHEFHIYEVLVSNLKDCITLAAKWMADRQPPDVTSSSQAPSRPPGQGPYSYQQVVEEYVRLIRFLCDNDAVHLPLKVASELWEALVVHPLTQQDQVWLVRAAWKAIGLSFFTNSSEFLQDDTLCMLVKSFKSSLPAEALSLPAFRCFEEAFVQVNRAEASCGDLTEEAQLVLRDDVTTMSGVEYLWDVILDCSRPDVLDSAMTLIKHCYAGKSREAFVRECTERLQASAKVLGLSPEWLGGPVLGVAGTSTHAMESAEWDTARRRVHRCLSMAVRMMDALQGRTMPPIPSHRASFRGPPLTLEVMFSSGTPPRSKLQCHANEYVGRVRQRVAAMLGCQANKLRLIQGGEEWKSDSQMLSQQGLRSRQPVQAFLSPQANRHYQGPVQYLATWRQESICSMLSQSHDIYRVISFLASLPGAQEVREQAVRVLQLLPTHEVIPLQLQHALTSQEPGARLRAMLLSGARGAVLVQPAHLLYTLQALYGVLFPVDSSHTLSASPSFDTAAEMADPMVMASPSGNNPTMNVEAMAVDTPRCYAPAATAAAASFAAGGPLHSVHVVSDCMPLLVEVVDLAVAAANGDLQFLRELHSLLVNMLGSIATAALVQHDVTAAINTVEGVGAPMLDRRQTADSTSRCDTPASLSGSIDVPPSPLGGAGPSTEAAAPGAEDAGSSGRTPTPPALALEAGVSSPVAAGPPGRTWHGVPPAVQPVSALTGSAMEMDGPTMCTMVSLLVRLAWDAGRQWGVPAAVAAAASTAGLQRSGGVLSGGSTFGGGRDAEGVVDVQLVRESFATIGRLLAACPQLYSAFLTDARVSALVQETLLSPLYEPVRTFCSRFLSRICLPSAAAGGSSGTAPGGPGAYAWLLELLAGLRPAAAARPAASGPYYDLFRQCIQSVHECGDVNSCGLAERVLQEELAALNDVEHCVLPANAEALQGRLRLLQALVSTLGRAGTVGCSRGDQPGLIRLLLTRYLFPEAVVLARHLSSERPNPTAPELAAAVSCCCTDADCRRAALDLVADVMMGSPANLEEGVDLLCDMHYRDAHRGQHAVLPTNHQRWNAKLNEQVRPPGGYMGMRNGGATCYMNAVVQQLFMQPRIRELVLGAKPVDPAEREDSVFHQLQIMFAHLALGRNGSYAPKPFWQAFKDYDGTPIDVQEHQDAYEFFTRLQDFVDQHMRSAGLTPAMHHVMGGRFAQQIICKDINYRSEREDEFYQLSVDVKGKGSLEKSLESYVQGELMEGENAYLCEERGCRVTAVKRSCIKELPQTLVIHLKRFEYDHLNMTRQKVRERFEFSPTLDMFRYSADGLAAMEGSAVQLALQQSGQPGGAVERARTHYLYDLKGIVVHSGTAFAGHYYSYIKERPKIAADGRVTDGQWFCFDDKSVKLWDLANLETDCFGGRPGHDSCNANTSSNSSMSVKSPRSGGRQEMERPYSAYMLFFERKDAAAYDFAGLPAPALPTQPACPTSPAPPATSAASLAAVPGAEPSSLAGGGPKKLTITLPATPIFTGGAHSGAPPSPMMISPLACAPSAATPNSLMSQWAKDFAFVAGAEPGLQSVLPQAQAQPPPVPQQSQQQAIERVASGGTAGGNDVHHVPYHMPLELYEQVLRENLQLMYRQHVLDKDYFKFVRQVVEAKWDSVLSSRKSRRKDPPSNSGGSSGRVAAAVVTTPRAPSPLSTQLPTVGSVVSLDEGGGSGATAMATTPTAGGAAAGAGFGTTSEVAESSSAPSQRGEDAERAAAQGVRLTTHFLVAVYHAAAPQLRTDSESWQAVFDNLLTLGPRACRAFTSTLLSHPGWLGAYLRMAPIDCPRRLAPLFTSVIRQMVQFGLLDGHFSTENDPERAETSKELHDLLFIFVEAARARAAEGVKHEGVELCTIYQVLTAAVRFSPYLADLLATSHAFGTALRLAKLTSLKVAEDRDDSKYEEIGDIACFLLSMAQRCDNWERRPLLLQGLGVSSAEPLLAPMLPRRPRSLHFAQLLPQPQPHAVSTAVDLEQQPLARGLLQAAYTLHDVSNNGTSRAQTSGCIGLLRALAWECNASTMTQLTVVFEALESTCDNELEGLVEAVLAIMCLEDKMYVIRASVFLFGQVPPMDPARGRNAVNNWRGLTFHIEFARSEYKKLYFWWLLLKISHELVPELAADATNWAKQHSQQLVWFSNILPLTIANHANVMDSTAPNVEAGAHARLAVAAHLRRLQEAYRMAVRAQWVPGPQVAGASSVPSALDVQALE